MSDDLVTPLRNAAYLAFEDGTNDYTTPALAAARIAKLEAALRFYADPSKYTDIHGDDVQVPDFYSETDFGETARVTLEGGKDE